VSRRGWLVAILSAWVLSLGWLVKREVFRPTGARLAAAALVFSVQVPIQRAILAWDAQSRLQPVRIRA